MSIQRRLRRAAATAFLAALVGCGGGEDDTVFKDKPPSHTCEGRLSADSLADRAVKTTLNDLDAYSLSSSVNAEGKVIQPGDGGEFRVGASSKSRFHQPTWESEQDGEIRIELAGVDFGMSLKAITQNDTLYVYVLDRWIKTDMTDQMWYESNPFRAIIPVLNLGEKNLSDSDSDSLAHRTLRVRSEDAVRSLMERTGLMRGGQMRLLAIGDHVLRVVVNSRCYIEKSFLDVDATLDYGGTSIRAEFEYEWHFSDINEPIEITLPEGAKEGLYVDSEQVEEWGVPTT